jgi:hypothetical protein
VKDFATKLPRLAEMARGIDISNPMETIVSDGLLSAALVDVKALGWGAPYSLLALVTLAEAKRKAAGPVTIAFDAHGNGPFCAHGNIPIFCPTCEAASDAEDRLLRKLVELAKGGV